MNCDTIFYLEEVKIIEQETYRELLQRNMKDREMAKEPKPRNTLKILTRIFIALSLQKIYHHEIV
jgi:hypothetical protein